MFKELRGYLAALLLAVGVSLPIVVSSTATDQQSQPAAASPTTAAARSDTPNAAPAAGASAPQNTAAANPVAPTVSVSFLPDSTTELVGPLTTGSGTNKFEAKTSILLRNNERFKVRISGFSVVLRNEAGELFQKVVEIKSDPDAVEISEMGIKQVGLIITMSGPSPAFGKTIEPLTGQWSENQSPSLSLVGYLTALAESLEDPKEGPPASSTDPAKQNAAAARSSSKTKAVTNKPGAQPPNPCPPPPKKQSVILARPLRLTPPIPSALSSWPVVLGLALAVITVIAGYLSLGKNKPANGLSEQMGLPVWDGSSWATNLTAVAAVLAALFTNLSQVKTQHLQSSEYNALIVLFGVLVILAPALYSALRTKVETDATVQSPTYKGYVGMFLVVTCVTLWAIFGEVITLLILMDETVSARITTLVVTRSFQGMVVAALILLIVYSVQAIRANTKRTPPRLTEGAGEPLPRWHVL